MSGTHPAVAVLVEFAAATATIRDKTYERNDIECADVLAWMAAMAEWSTTSTGPEPKSPGPDPHWKRWIDAGLEDCIRPPQAEWCDACRRREALTQELRPLRQRRGVLIRRMLRLGRTLAETGGAA